MSTENSSNDVSSVSNEGAAGSGTGETTFSMAQLSQVVAAVTNTKFSNINNVSKLPLFSGKDAKTKSVSYQEWIYYVDKLIEDRVSNSMSEKDISSCIFNSVIGDAKSLYIRYDRLKYSLSDILEKFNLKYGDRTSALEKVEMLASLKQEFKESINEYAERLESMIDYQGAGTLYENEDNKKTKFVNGLRNKAIADKLLYLSDDSSRTYDELKAKAVFLERRETESKPAKSVQDNSKDMKRMEEKLTSMQKMVEETMLTNHALMAELRQSRARELPLPPQNVNPQDVRFSGNY